ncbi:MAG: hypothetical protein IBX64_07535 [Actinobacteria bacterium]|nr:hypothetical protein [Actinomycetota bacterium]
MKLLGVQGISYPKLGGLQGKEHRKLSKTILNARIAELPEKERCWITKEIKRYWKERM